MGDQCLQADGIGVFRQKVGIVVEQFLTQPGDWIQGESVHEKPITGFQGGGKSFYLGVMEGDKKDDTDIVLCFLPASDIKIRVEWSVSIQTPSGEVLKTSIVSRTTFEHHNGASTPLGAKEPKCKLICQPLPDQRFMDRKEIKDKGWLFDEALHLVADVRFKILEGGYESSSATPNPLLCALKNQLDCPVFTDFILVSQDGEHIKTHKLILGLRSPVFRAMFDNDLEEARTGVCRIEDANSQSIRAMIAYLVGVEPQEWSFDLAKSLFELADKYELPDLLQKCAVELSKGLTTKTLVDVILLAHRHSMEKLLNEAFVFLEDNFSQASTDGVFVRLVSEKECGTIIRDWQAHWFYRKEGVEMGKVEEPAMDVDPEQKDFTKGSSS